MRQGLSTYPPDLLAVPLLTVLAVLAELAWPGGNIIAVAAGLLLVLVLPGYALQAAVAPKAQLGGIERALLTAGISVAVTILGGLYLSWTPGGMQPRAWALLLGGVAIAASLAALRRSEVVRSARVTNVLGPLTGRQAAMLALAAFVAGSALTIAALAEANQPYQTFTQLWALPAGTAGQRIVRLGIRNGEGEDQQYRLEVLANSQVIREWSQVSVGTGQEWQMDLRLAPGRADEEIEARLYRADAPGTIYRQVRLSAVAPPG